MTRDRMSRAERRALLIARAAKAFWIAALILGGLVLFYGIITAIDCPTCYGIDGR